MQQQHDPVGAILLLAGIAWVAYCVFKRANENAEARRATLRRSYEFTRTVREVRVIQQQPPPQPQVLVVVVRDERQTGGGCEPRVEVLDAPRAAQQALPAPRMPVYRTIDLPDDR
jgi:hypothetical protein